MTKTNFPSRVSMPCPFAGSGATLGVIDNTDSDNMNFPKGFPTVYGAPSSSSGKFVTRGEMNRLGNIATANDYYRMCGGLNTFSIEHAHLIGGYPEGAVLDMLIDDQLFKVISLRDNNKVNPHGIAGTGIYSDIVAGSVDKVNWMFLNQNYGIDDGKLFVGSFSRTPLRSEAKLDGTNLISTDFFELISAFKVPRTGLLYAENIKYRSNFGPSDELQVNQFSLAVGNGIVYKNLGSDPSALENITEPSIQSSNGWKQLGGFGSNIHTVVKTASGNPTNQWSLSSSVPYMHADDYFAIGIFYGCYNYIYNAGSKSYFPRGCVGYGEQNPTTGFYSDPLTFDLYIR